MVVELDFQRNGVSVFKSVNFAGYIGVLTGIKPHRFTLVRNFPTGSFVRLLTFHYEFGQTLDERFSLDGGFVGIIRWLLGDRKASWAGFLMREVLDEAPGYPEALTKLTTTKLLAPVYFILGGNTSEQVRQLSLFNFGQWDLKVLTFLGSKGGGHHSGTERGGRLVHGPRECEPKVHLVPCGDQLRPLEQAALLRRPPDPCYPLPRLYRPSERLSARLVRRPLHSASHEQSETTN